MFRFAFSIWTGFRIVVLADFPGGLVLPVETEAKSKSDQ
jgi:hypothetical protein